MIKHLIDTSLKFKKISNDINTSEDKLLKSDFSLFYINKHTISSDNLNFFTMTSSLISNFNIQSAMMLMITLKSLIKIDKYIDDIYDIRKKSIKEEGEFGLNNLVFKEIRRRGYLAELKELRNKKLAQNLSLENLN